MEKKVSIEGNITNSINFAMQQNYVPVIKNLVINNQTEEMLSDLVLKISFEPEFAKEYSTEIAEVLSGQSVEISPVRIQLKTDFLFSLTEKMVGNITIELFQGVDRIYSFEDTMEVLAYDEWSGLLFMPEIITAFVTPNHPKIAEVISDASKVLAKWTKSPAFTGYQTQNPNTVKLQMAAIYAAIQEQNIIYNNPPASYEVIGQRIRLPHVVLEQKQGTCLDLAVLYSACLESVGLFPLLVFKPGHAFVGCWLEEETFADCVSDDISSLEKRIVEGAEEILLLECTDLVAGRNIAFDQAVKHGKDHLIHYFECIVVDIQRSRGSGIRPIPLRLEQCFHKYGENSNENSDEIKNDILQFHAPTELDSSLLGKVVEGNAPITKQKLWERKLLDFSLRNTLLNFRITKNSIQLMTANLGELEDRLSDGKDFRIMELPTEWTISLRDSKIFEIENERDLIQSIATAEFKSARIRTFLEEMELDKSLKNLYRSAKVSMEENGTNTMFLALGFLRWFESDLSEKPRYAPIVLIPIDIVRNVRNKGFIIRNRQEDAQINVTLLEYLRQDYGINISGLDPLPEDEHGVDLPLVFHTIRQAVMGKSRWNIDEVAFIGLFSFGQFVMWNDIRNRAKELEENKVVSSLIRGELTWQPDAQKISVDNLEEEISIKNMAIPVSADSSQMVAIAAAASGKSFVLHGPPGTGKSQTITNMIANALYQGKTVLFVAEKMAALNVVQKRLENIGLDPFCLELHSNKTNKTAVLAELNKALEVGRIKSPVEYEKVAENLHKLRTELNDIMDALHKKREYGVSLYTAIELYEQNKEEKGNIVFEKGKIKTLDKETVDRWHEYIRRYAVAVKEIGDYQIHPLMGYEGTEYSIQLRETFVHEVGVLLAGYSEVEHALEFVLKCCGIHGSKDKNTDNDTIETILSAIDALLLPAMSLNDLMIAPNFDRVYETVKHLVHVGKQYQQLFGWFEERFELSILEYPVEQGKMKWKQSENTWFLPKLLHQKKLVKEISLYAKSTNTISKDNIMEVYNRLSEYLKTKNEILQMPVELTQLCSGMYLGLQTDWDALDAALQKAERFQHACIGLSYEVRNSLVETVRKCNDTAQLSHMKERIAAYLTAIEKLEITYKINIGKEKKGYHWIDEVTKLFTVYKEHSSEMRNMVSFNQIDLELRACGLAEVSAAYKTGKINANTLLKAFKCNLYYEFVLQTIEEEECLSEFHGKYYEDKISQYVETMNHYQHLTIQELVAKLSAKIPDSGVNGAATSELGILKKAIKSNGRMLSLRRLFDQIPTLLRKLCPCMLMSPISVAQYIDPSFPKFDLVIFDEASQLPTSEAVGTIARGENVVVVGDPKQLPPTNFFSSNRIDEENCDKEDLESLLDDCLAISMPQEHLKWHYRSRHESLIAFSNMKYYDNKLYTFPSPRDLVSEVKLVPVEGYYDKGKTKHNKAEARAIVDEIIRRLQDETLCNDSIGVVTFSSVQQNLIDDMLYEEFKKHPELEEMDRNSKESIFIKNLENVQGDERDIILFSIGYGPDKEGKVSMNFGPLNREGGWRRLNVAISRARKSMIVYAVIRPEQIDLSRTRSDGVAGLKGFLEFAQRGKNVLAQRIGGSKFQEDYIVNEVSEAIKQLGYEVKTNVGCSKYKLDLAVLDPDDTNHYLLGIQLDGENSKEAAMARDRFIVQPGVLKGLGWSLMRIWTLDWLDNPEYVISEMKRSIEAASVRVVEVKTQNKANTKVAGSVYSYEGMEKEESTSSVCEPYISLNIPVKGGSEEYYLPDTMGTISNAIQSIIEEEAPISRKLLMRKVLAAWGISRGGSRVESIFNAAINTIEKRITLDDNREFIWKSNQFPDEYRIYRVEDSAGNKRSMEEIPSQEILNALSEVLLEQIGLSETDLIRETAKKFGFSRMGNLIETTVQYTINHALSKGKLLRLENGNIIANG